MYHLNENPSLSTASVSSSPTTGTLKPRIAPTGTQLFKTYSKEAKTLSRTYPQPRKFQRQEGRAPFY